MNRLHRRAQESVSRKVLRAAIKQWRGEAKAHKMPLLAYLEHRAAMIDKAVTEGEESIQVSPARMRAWRHLYSRYSQASAQSA